MKFTKSDEKILFGESISSKTPGVIAGVPAKRPRLLSGQQDLELKDLAIE